MARSVLPNHEAPSGLSVWCRLSPDKSASCATWLRPHARAMTPRASAMKTGSAVSKASVMQAARASSLLRYVAGSNRRSSRGRRLFFRFSGQGPRGDDIATLRPFVVAGQQNPKRIAHPC